MSDANQCYQRALRLLAIKSRFSSELKKRLEKELFSREAIAFTIEKCTQLHFLDDDQLTERKIESYSRKGYGTHRILHKLSPSITEEKTKKALFSFNEQKTLETYLLHHPKLLQDPKCKIRLYRRGFSIDVICHVLQNWKETSL